MKRFTTFVISLMSVSVKTQTLVKAGHLLDATEACGDKGSLRPAVFLHSSIDPPISNTLTD